MRKCVKYSLLSLFCVLGLCLQRASAQRIEPITTQAGGIEISIDPRMELLNAVEYLADFGPINYNSQYTYDIASYFAKYGKMRTKELKTSFDDLRLGLSGYPELFLNLSLDSLSSKAVIDTNIFFYSQEKIDVDKEQKFLKVLSFFIKETNFKSFWDGKRQFYNKILELSKNEIANIDFKKNIEEYYNDEKKNFKIIISPPTQGGFGIRYKTIQDPKNTICAVCCTNAIKDSIPYMDSKNLNYMAWHEFSHSYVNPLTQNHRAVIESQNIFDSISIQFIQRYPMYNTWEACVYEHFVRAANIRLLNKVYGAKVATEQIGKEKELGFYFIEPIVEAFKGFEKNRDEKNVSFTEYFPQLIAVLDTLRNGKFLEYLPKNITAFQGPMNAMQKDEMLIIYPTNEKDTSGLVSLRSYISYMFNWTKSRGDVSLVADTEALKSGVKDYNIIVYGTLESNLFLAKYKSNFPFKIEKGVLYADAPYNSNGTKFISCLPNPQNNKKGMRIYTGLNNSDICNINSIMHGGEDFLVADENNKILSRGYYNKKSDLWKFESQNKGAFAGPINSVFFDKIYLIYPTNDNDPSSLKIVQDYVKNVYEKIKSQFDIKLISDSTAISSDISDRSLIAYGTLESNLFLAKYKDRTPFKFENGVLYADKAYKNSSTRIVSCLPNPTNPDKGMTIVAAEKDSIFSTSITLKNGENDYLIYDESGTLIEHGFYNKQNGWRFAE